MRRSRFEHWSRGLFGHPDKEEQVPSKDPYEVPMPTEGEAVSNVDDTPHPEHPIAGTDDVPTHPIAGTDDTPAHPIELPDGETGEPIDPPDTGPDVAELSFWERVVEGFNWDPAAVGEPDSHVDILVTTPETGETIRVRTVDNTGSSYVTFPGDFQGERRITVVGGSGVASGELTVPQH
jgi:hypothetical protein